jgi:acyl carrier protein
MHESRLRMDHAHDTDDPQGGAWVDEVFLSGRPAGPDLPDLRRTSRRNPMLSTIREYVIESLEEMNYDVDGIGDNTTLGPSGADLESLAIAELAVRIEDRFGVRFTEDEAEELAGMTVGEFCSAVGARLDLAQTPGE